MLLTVYLVCACVCERVCVISFKMYKRGCRTNETDLQYHFTYFMLNYLFEMLHNTTMSAFKIQSISETNTRNKGTCRLLLLTS